MMNVTDRREKKTMTKPRVASVARRGEPLSRDHCQNPNVASEPRATFA